ncbi:Asp23/Gls24 family envelope stress response protein [Klenkia sp. PcliD-1-E]|uniref:Asp23/Gls24 family envelope stress response protein n=1 Tax=Klenkia sp. PcliD-1-E TaxID=2954492 RepID=UPI002096E7D6|nr:Asp23/Gls24 family envelope stress response protein [Klenkia sp. PcliD-1-E]MCO7218358.1 Asp23/Gls24 family envelope stress response protein [Klenkia sp. PcliD-1-E]
MSLTASADPRLDTPPEDRGRLDIKDRVIVKIAAHAATGIEHATGSPHRVLGVAIGDELGAPAVTAQVHGDIATITIDLGVAWPASIIDVTRAVRAAVIDRLTTLADIHTAQVDIAVTAMPAPRSRRGRVA